MPFVNGGWLANSCWSSNDASPRVELEIGWGKKLEDKNGLAVHGCFVLVLYRVYSTPQIAVHTYLFEMTSEWG